MRPIALILSLILASSAALSEGLGPAPGLRSGGKGDASEFSLKAGSASRSLAARAREEINALDYGLVCDDATDNKDAIARIEAAIKTNTTVYFPPAALPCRTSRPLNVVKKDRVTIRAAPGTVTLRAIPATPEAKEGPLLFGAAEATDVLVYGLTFHGGGKDFPNNFSVTQGYDVDSLVFDTVTVLSTRGIATSFSIAKASGVRNSTYRDIGHHWKTTKVSTDRKQAMAWSCARGPDSPCNDDLDKTLAGNFAHNNIISDIGLDPISFGNGVNVSAVGNRCEMRNDQLSDPGLVADAYAGCVYTTKVTGATITGNYAVGATGNAIDIHETTGFAVSGNYIEGSGQAGIGVFGSYGAVTGNTILNSGGWTASPYRAGIALAGPHEGVSIQGNLIADNRDIKAQPYGIQGYAGSCTGCTIANNAIFGMVTADYGGYLSGPTPLAAGAGGTGLTGRAWTPWVPSLTATGGTGVMFNVLSAAYEQTGKTLRGRMTLQVNDGGARPSEISFGLPGGQSLASGATGSAINFSTGAALQLASNGATALRLRPLTPGGPFLDASGQFLALSFEVEVQ